MLHTVLGLRSTAGRWTIAAGRLGPALVAAGLVGWALGPAPGVLATPLVMASMELAARHARRRSSTATGGISRPAHGDLEAAVVACVRAVLRADDGAEIERALQGLLIPAGCEAISISRTIGTGAGAASHVIHAAGGYETAARPTPWSESPGAHGTLSEGRIHTGRAASGMRARAEIPIMIDGGFTGHVGLVRAAGHSGWDDHELEVLSALADMAGAAWTRLEALDRLGETIRERDRSIDLQLVLGDVSRILLEDVSDRSYHSALQAILAPMDAAIGYMRAPAEHPLYGTGLETVAVALEPGTAPPRYLASGWTGWPVAHVTASAGEIAAIDDVELLPPAASRWYAQNAPHIRSELVAPIVTDSEVTGLVAVGRPDAHAWTDQERSTLKLVANRGLEDLVRSKDRFIASVSHELRTPISVVMGLSSELNTRRSDFSETEVSEFIDLIARQSREVGHIIEDLLVSARVSASSITVLPEPIRLDEVIREALTELSTDHTRRIVRTSISPVSTFADPLRIRQIVRNLLSNGHRHGGGQVFITVRELDGGAVVDVSDDGAGLQPHLVESSFERYSAGGALEGRPASIGLGLTVSRQLARLMGGDVIYVSDPMPTFRLWLPLGTVPEKQDVEPPGTTARTITPWVTT
jgi:signal transduction histidine kinase